MDKEMKFSKSLAHGIILARRRRRRRRRQPVSRPRLLSLRACTVAEASFCHFTIRGLLRDVLEDEEEEEVREGGRGVWKKETGMKCHLGYCFKDCSPC